MATIRAMACPTCTRLERDEALLRDAVQERAEALRFELPEELRAEVEEEEERLLATLVARIEERRAA
jgi:NMD protein affecting ribosome stability and mRNA decay